MVRVKVRVRARVRGKGLAERARVALRIGEVGGALEAEPT